MSGSHLGDFVLMAPKILLKDALDLAERLHRIKPFPHFRRIWKTLHVPPKVLPELDRRSTRIGLVLLHHPRMLERDREFLLDRRRRAHRLPLHQVSSLIEHPGLPKCPTSDHHRRATGLSPHPERIFGGFDIAIADDGNVERIDHRSDFFPPRRAGVHLRARTRVQRERSRAGILATKRDLNRVAHLLVPPAANLDSHREVRARRNTANHLLNEIEITKAARAPVPPHDLLHGTAEVDVDELGLEDLRHESSRIAHRLRLRTEYLNANRALVSAELELRDGRGVLAPDPFRRKKLGHDYVRAESSADSAERRLRHSRHRREIERHFVIVSEWERHDFEANGAYKCLQLHGLPLTTVNGNLRHEPRRTSTQEALDGAQRVFFRRRNQARARGHDKRRCFERAHRSPRSRREVGRNALQDAQASGKS